MKVFITLFGFLVLVSSGIHSGIAQETKKMELTVSEYKELTPAHIAKLQTQNLQELLSLDVTQVSMVYDTMLNVEQNMVAIVASGISEETKMVEIQKWEVLKTQKLKEILTVEQFTRYLDTVKNNRR